MIQTMLVIDDFFANPVEVREQAFKLTYPPTHEDDQFGGRTSVEVMLPQDSDEGFSQILREPVMGKEDIAHGHCRFSISTSVRRGEIHVDPGCAWSGVICLTLDEHCQGGTEFFRNKRYGTDRVPLSDEEAKQVYSMDSLDEVYEKIIKQEGRDRSQWECIQTLPLKFSRAIFFRPWLWHAGGVDFGDCIENGRLTQILFFGSARKQKQS